MSRKEKGPHDEDGLSGLTGSAGIDYGFSWVHPSPPVMLQPHAPQAISAAETPKMSGHSLKGRKATLNPVNKETTASTTSVPIAIA